MNNKLKISLLAFVLIISVFVLSGCQNEENTANNTQNEATENTTNSIRSAVTEATASTALEDLEKYNKEEDANYKTYTGTDGTSFMYPSSWVSVGTDEEPAYMSPDIKGASVNIATDTIEKEGSTITEFDSYISLQKLYLVQQMTMLTDIDQKIVNLNGKKAYILNYVTESEQSDSNTTIDLNITQVAFEEDGNVYILTMAVLNDYYNDLQSTFDKITKSFMKETTETAE